MAGTEKPGHMGWELEVEQTHRVTESGVDSDTDVYVPSHVDCVPEALAETLWEEFGKDAEDDLGLTVVDE